jgi:hypothetical protein
MKVQANNYVGYSHVVTGKIDVHGVDVSEYDASDIAADVEVPDGAENNKEGKE